MCLSYPMWLLQNICELQLVLSLFERWELKDFPKSSQNVNGTARIWSKLFLCKTLCTASVTCLSALRWGSRSVHCIFYWFLLLIQAFIQSEYSMWNSVVWPSHTPRTRSGWKEWVFYAWFLSQKEKYWHWHLNLASWREGGGRHLKWGLPIPELK